MKRTFLEQMSDAADQGLCQQEAAILLCKSYTYLNRLACQYDIEFKNKHRGKTRWEREKELLDMGFEQNIALEMAKVYSEDIPLTRDDINFDSGFGVVRKLKRVSLKRDIEYFMKCNPLMIRKWDRSLELAI